MNTEFALGGMGSTSCLGCLVRDLVGVKWLVFLSLLHVKAFWYMHPELHTVGDIGIGTGIVRNVEHTRLQSVSRKSL